MEHFENDVHDTGDPARVQFLQIALMLINSFDVYK
jgi:hypothetical protein